jgi:trehalose-6-phosphatase
MAGDLRTGSALSSSYPDGHIDDLAAQVGNVLANVSGPSWSVERWKYCANYTPMSSEHGCERLSHDQPIVFSRP